MLTTMKNIFKPARDGSGRKIDSVILRLAAQTKTNPHAWSYIQEVAVYENTANGQKVYPHELTQYAA